MVYEDSSYVEEDIYEDEEEETSGSFETYEEEQNEQDDILFINDNITREKNNYSASAVMEILFQLKGFDESQNAIARRLNIQNGGIADYELVVSTLNDILQNHGYGKTFAGVYLEPEQIDALNEEYFQESIERNLSQGYPVIVCINGKRYGGSDDTAYALIYGKSKTDSDSETWRIFCPIQSGEAYELSLDELISAMKDCGFLCYIQ